MSKRKQINPFCFSPSWMNSGYITSGKKGGIIVVLFFHAGCVHAVRCYCIFEVLPD